MCIVIPYLSCRICTCMVLVFMRNMLRTLLNMSVPVDKCINNIDSIDHNSAFSNMQRHNLNKNRYYLPALVSFKVS